MTSPFLTATELARRWRTTKQSLRNQRFKKQGPPYTKIGNRILYKTEDVETFENQNHTSTDT
jgi:hypothetical protein